MKLSILVPQYKETDKIIRPLLDSIQLQQNIDFDELEVVIINDGSGIFLNEETFKDYDYKIRYIKDREINKGVSYTRNELIEKAQGDYLMFCDADDMFFSVMGLFMVFQEIDKGFDIFSSAFIEENRIEDKPAYIVRSNDRVFVHGKVVRKQYLIDKDISWDNELKIHEDYYFFAQCFALTDQIRYCPEHFYLWKYRNDSVCRQDKNFLLKTYVNVIESQIRLARELVRKKAIEQCQFYVSSFVYLFFNEMKRDKWNCEWKEQTINKFAEYWKEFKKYFNRYPNKTKLMTSYRIDEKEFKKFIKGIANV